MMRIRLSFKLFGAFFPILASVVGALGFSRYLFECNFENYIRQMERERLQWLVPALQAEYKSHHGWTGIQSNTKRWDRMMHDMPEMDRPGPPPPMDEGMPGGSSRVLLLNARQHPVLGKPGPGDQRQRVPIEVDGQVVGWLGLKTHEPSKQGI